MSVPSCIWLRNPVQVNNQAMFLFETGGLDCTVTGEDVVTDFYPASQGPRILVVHSFATQGEYTWTVTNTDGSCSSTIAVTG